MLAAVAQVASAFFSRNQTRLEDIDDVIARIQKALSRVAPDDIGPLARNEALAATMVGPVQRSSDAQSTTGLSPVAQPQQDTTGAAPQPSGGASLIPAVEPEAEAKLRPAVPIEESITDQYIICLEDGRKLQTLKRYLKAQYQMTPQQYIRKWGLPTGYPMVSAAYSRTRSAAAKAAGLGRRRRGGRESDEG